MHQNFICLYMIDIISLFKNDLNSLIENLQNKNIISNFKINNVNIDFSSKSKQGDISTNILLVLNKKNLNKDFNLKNHISIFFKNLKYVDKIEIAKAGFINIFIKKEFIILNLKDIYNEVDLKKLLLTKNKKLM